MDGTAANDPIAAIRELSSKRDVRCYLVLVEGYFLWHLLPEPPAQPYGPLGFATFRLVFARNEQSAAAEAFRRVRRRTEYLGLTDPGAANMVLEASEITREPIRRLLQRDPGMAFWHEE